MSWIGPTAKQGAKLAVKYGPQAKVAWDKGGKQATQAATRAAQRQLQRRKAFTKAGTVRAGEVLRLVENGEPLWVVLSEGAPVDSYPTAKGDLADLMTTAEPSRAVTFAAYDEKRVRNRARSLRRRRR